LPGTVILFGAVIPEVRSIVRDLQVMIVGLRDLLLLASREPCEVPACAGMTVLKK